MLTSSLSFAGGTLLSDQASIDSNVGGAHTIQDESLDLTKRSNLNFTGAGVVCTDDSGNNQTDCTITAGGSGYNTVQEEGSGLTQRDTINFIGADITCVDNSGNTRTDCTVSAGGGGGFDVITSPPTEIQLVEEFMSGNLLMGNIGNLGWQFLKSGSATFSYSLGSITLKTGASSSSRANLYLSSLIGDFPTSSFFDTLFFHQILIGSQQAVFRFGISNTTDISTRPANGIYMEKLNSSANWFYVTRSSGTETRTDSGVIGGNLGVARRFRIRRKDASTIAFSIDGGVETDHTTNIPAIAATLVIGLINEVAADKQLDIDYISLKITGLSR